MLLTAMGLAPPRVVAQDSTGSSASALAGGALGLVSGAVLGTMGSIPPCWQTPAGLGCVRWGVGMGAAVGTTSGAVIGFHDSDRIERQARSAAIGFGIGAVAGLALVPIAQRFGWQDVIAMGVMGGAIGAAPLGAAIGFAGGTLVGAVLTRTVSDFTLPDAVGTGIVGLSLGALAEWAVTAINAGSDGSPPGAQLVVPLTLRF